MLWYTKKKKKIHIQLKKETNKQPTKNPPQICPTVVQTKQNIIEKLWSAGRRILSLTFRQYIGKAPQE